MQKIVTKDAFQNIVCKTEAILSHDKCVKQINEDTTYKYVFSDAGT